MGFNLFLLQPGQNGMRKSFVLLSFFAS